MWSRFTIAAIADAGVGGIADTGTARGIVATSIMIIQPTAIPRTTTEDLQLRFPSVAGVVAIGTVIAIGAGTGDGAVAGRRESPG